MLPCSPICNRIEIHAREALYLRDKIENVYVERTGQSKERIHDDMERDRFFSPDEAVEYGLIDRVQIERSGRERQQAGFTPPSADG